MLERQIYSAPVIEIIQLDNEISLALESLPPYPGNEGMNKMPENFNNDMFHKA